MKLDLYNLTNEKIGEVEVSDDVFGVEVRPHLFHEVVKMQLANRRRGTHKGKTRSEVSGGGKKPFKQKGTGNARQGTSRSPHMVGGGWAFAKRNRDYSYSLGKKKMRAALCSALSMVAGEGKMKVVDNFDLEAIKTKVAASTLNTLKVDRALVVDCKAGDKEFTTLNNENLRLSVRNLQNYKYLRPEGVNVYDILHYGGVVVTRQGLERLEARLKG
ncbi:MAG: 50S ribosomal protein L4 [Proteobacteria bacterium]|nr:50S ribosomal protein L4 [Pseudomonadota bacterium]